MSMLSVSGFLEKSQTVKHDRTSENENAITRIDPSPNPSPCRRGESLVPPSFAAKRVRGLSFFKMFSAWSNSTRAS